MRRTTYAEPTLTAVHRVRTAVAAGGWSYVRSFTYGGVPQPVVGLQHDVELMLLARQVHGGPCPAVPDATRRCQPKPPHTLQAPRTCSAGSCRAPPPPSARRGLHQGCLTVRWSLYLVRRAPPPW